MKGGKWQSGNGKCLSLALSQSHWEFWRAELREAADVANVASQGDVGHPLGPPRGIDPLLSILVRLFRLPLFFLLLPQLTGIAPAQVSYQDLLHPDPKDWLTYSGDYSGRRHSMLNQIHTKNIASLAAEWIYPVPGANRLLVTPLEFNGLMYVTGHNSVFALDARTGREIWRYSRPLRPDMISGDARPGINRGVAVLGEKVFFETQDAHLLALHAKNGSLIWETEIADYRDGYGGTMAPLVVKDKVIIGTSGGDEGVRGLLDAYNAETGKRQWRFWTIPAPGEPGSETWKGSAIEHGCGATWLTGTFDPELNLLYWTTGNPCPDFYAEDRLGDNLYTDCVLALDVDTGKLKWHYQFTPHDTHDWDATQVPMLIDGTFEGRPRKLMAQADRNGFFYVLDRTNGKLLMAKPFVKSLNWAKGIGPDGKPEVLPDTDPTPQGNKTCPAVVGATNWYSPSFNPQTGLFYVITMEQCNEYMSSARGYEKGKGFEGTGAQRIASEPGQKFLRAIDIRTGNLRWEYPMVGEADSWAGTLSTAGGLVFFGDDSGYLVAVDAETGKALWHFNTGAIRLSASPMTFAINGQQFITLAAGTNIVTFRLIH